MLSNVAILNQKCNIEIMSETVVTASYAVCLNVSAELAVQVFPVAIYMVISTRVELRETRNCAETHHLQAE